MPDFTYIVTNRDNPGFTYIVTLRALQRPMSGEEMIPYSAWLLGSGHCPAGLNYLADKLLQGKINHPQEQGNQENGGQHNYGRVDNLFPSGPGHPCKFRFNFFEKLYQFF